VLLLALVVLAGASMAGAWALHPSWVRHRITKHDGSEPGPVHRFFGRVPEPHLNGNSNGNGDAPTRVDWSESPVVTPGARPDVHTEGHYLEGFDLRSVARFTLRFFTCVFAALVVAIFALWAVASVLGLVGAFERFMRGIGFTDFRLLSIEFLLGLCLVGVAFCVFMVVFTCVAAALYNVLAHRWEGVRVYLSSASATTPGPMDAPVEEPLTESAMVSSDGEAVAPPARLRKPRVLARVGRDVRP
jgi:hypothetical protein